MFILDRRRFLAISAGAAGAAVAPASRAAGVEGAELFTADASGALVDSVVVMGEERALLVDAQFTAPNAARLADVIASTGRVLETIFVTHFHPDHFLGLPILAARFPEARIVAHPAVREQIEAAAPAMLAGVRQAFGAEFFPEMTITPDALSGDRLTLEGERIDVMPPMHGDTALITPLHLPSIGTLIATDVIYSGTHVWVAENQTDAEIDAWLTSLDQLEAMGAQVVFPGHHAPDADMSEAIDFTRSYLGAWRAAIAETSDAASLKAALLERVGELPFDVAVDRAVAARYPE